MLILIDFMSGLVMLILLKNVFGFPFSMCFIQRMHVYVLSIG